MADPNSTLLTNNSAVFANVKLHFQNDLTLFQTYIDRVNQSPSLVIALNDYQSAGKVLKIDFGATELVYDGKTRELTINGTSLLSPTYFVRGLAHEIYGHDQTRNVIADVLDASNARYANKTPEQVGALAVEGCFAVEMLGFLGEYRVGLEAGFSPTGFPTLENDIVTSINVINEFLPSGTDSRVVDLAVANYLATKAQANDGGHALQCAAWAQYVVDSQARGVIAPAAQKLFIFDVSTGESSIEAQSSAYKVSSHVQNDGTIVVGLKDNAGALASTTTIQVFDDGSRVESASDLRSNRTIITFFDLYGNPVSSVTPLSANGTENSSLTVTTNPTLTPRLDAPDDPISSPNADGTALGSSTGIYQVSVNASVLNTNTDLASAIIGDSATGGVRPGNASLSGTDGQLTTIATWGDAFDQASAAGTANLLAATTQNAGINVAWVPADPLVLDLNGDGVKLTSYTDKTVLFDIDNDGGSKEQTGWVAANTITSSPPAINTDGIVVYDPNNTGVISNISQTLSEYFGGSAGSGGNAGTKLFANGFAALKSLDLTGGGGNNDNTFTSADNAWGSVKVWVDDNADGINFKDTNGNGARDSGEATELKTFAELGITSINLVSTSQSGLINGGNEVLATGNFVIGGATRDAQAANFLANPNGHSFIDKANGSNTGTKITTEGSSSVLSYVSHATPGANNIGESMNAATLGVANLYGSAGNDTLTGDTGANWLAGGAGSDNFNAGAGDDVLLIDASDLQANIHAGTGNDIAQVVGDAGVTLNLTQAEVEIVQGGRGNDVLIGGGRSSVFVRGGEGDDILIGGAANDVLSGEDGDDLIDGGAGNDLIRGHRGRDVLLGGVGDDIMDGGLDDDRLSGGDGNDVLKGSQGDDVIDGGAGTDIAEFAGSFADYRLTQLVAGSGGQSGTWRVVDTRANRGGGNEGADTLTNIEKLNFADLSAVDIALDNPMPVKNVLTTYSSTYSVALFSFGPNTALVDDLLANDIDWQRDVLHVTSISDVKGGYINGPSSDGVYVFYPDMDQAGHMLGPASFKYTIADADGTPGATAIQVATNVSAEMQGQVFINSPDMPTDPVFSDQWYLRDINVMPVWADYTGEGVRIGQFEPSGPYAVSKEIFEYRHPDLQGNVDMAWLADMNAPPGEDFSNHATLVAGVMVAARNGQGAVGVAYDAKLSGFQFGDTITSTAGGFTADAANLNKLRDYDVANNSWALTGMFATTAPPIAETFFRPAVVYGRGGLGTNIVIAGGNDRQAGGNTNYSEPTSNRYAIVTGAINAQADISTLTIGSVPFSNPGASILISAPGSNVSSTSKILINDEGSVFGSDTSSVQGTSFAVPIISGIVALMLEANPKLGYRDVQQILALSGRRVNDSNTDTAYNGATNWNGGGMHTSHDYGFGDVDARAAVRLAETWTITHAAGNERHLAQSEGSLAPGGANLGVAISNGAVLTRTLSLGAGLRAEHVDVSIDLNHSNWGDLTVELISPSGTISVLVANPGTTAAAPGGVVGDPPSGHLQYSFDTTHSYGENAQGLWALRITDRAGLGTGTLNGWKVDAYGSDLNETVAGLNTSGESPVISATANDTYFFTDEFSTTPDQYGRPQRSTLADSNGGTDTVNAAAVTGNSTINLVDGGSSTINDRSVIISGAIEFAYGGDGNDSITGNSINNRLVGGRGGDVIDAAAGEDYVDGGKGNDTLTGGAGSDLVIIRRDAGAFDTITDFTPSAPGEKILVVGFDGVTDYSGLDVTADSPTSTLVSLPDGQRVLLQNVAASSITEQNFSFFATEELLVAYTAHRNGSISYGTSSSNSGLLSNSLPSITYYGLGGDDVSEARTGNDMVDGGDGNDTVWGDYPGETPNPGDDWLEGGAGTDVLYGGPGQDRLFGGTGGDELYGEANDDYLAGGGGQDYLDGGAGGDTLLLDGDQGTINGAAYGYYGTRFGGSGADTFEVTANGGGMAAHTSYSGSEFSGDNLIADFDVNQTGEVIDLSVLSWIRGFADLAIDTITTGGVSIAQVTASAGTQQMVINLRGVTSGQLAGAHFKFASAPGLVLGGSAADILSGTAGGNIVIGGAGADTLTGRTGDDTYSVDNEGDTVIELPGGGFDTVQASVSHALMADVENLILIGTGAINGTGNVLANRITGNSAANVLDGGGGADALLGGAGNDTYVVDNQGDSITENLGEGTDLVQASVSFTLGENIESLTLTGTASINATGNTLSNILIGNASDNVIDGAAGVDSMTGGAGDDTYFVEQSGDVVTESASEGIDTVYSGVNITALAANVENLVLFGTATAGTGNALDNQLVGNGLNNTLNGGGGKDFIDGGSDTADTLTGGGDSLTGGAGDDTYVVDSTRDVVTEIANEGNDTVQASITFDLTSRLHLENVILTGTASLSATGNAADNRLIGNAAANSLSGGGGGDTLDGGAGIDTLTGGTGNDTFVVDNADDVVVEALNEGTDTIVSSLTWSLTAQAHVENLSLTGFANLNGTGNALSNVIAGNSGRNVLEGGVGNDSLSGGSGDDVYVFGGGFGTEWITEAGGTTDIIRFGAGIAATNVTSTRSTNHLVVTLTTTGESITVENYFTDAQALIERIEFDDGTARDGYAIRASLNSTINGAGGNDTLAGSAGADMLNGLGGIDSLSGNDGDDVIAGGAGTDTLAGGAGVDTLDYSAETGNVTAELWRGSVLNDGTGGVDTISGFERLVGGAGNDLLSGDWLSNFVDGRGGNDRVYGQEADDTLLGGTGDDTLVAGAGADYVDGDAGSDTLDFSGLGGNVRAEIWDGSVLSDASGYSDRIVSIENLTGGDGSDLLSGDWRANRIEGGSGNDDLWGQEGNDTLVGGAGDDSLKPGAGTDSIEGGAGVDSLDYGVMAGAVTAELWRGSVLNDGTSSVDTFTGIENLAGGAGNDLLSGDYAANRIEGGAGNDDIWGQEGNDTLAGGVGADTLRGGSGADVYKLARGDGADTVIENDTASNVNDVASFGAGIAFDQLWFRMVGSGDHDLEASVIGTNDRFVFQNWDLGDQYHVEQFKTTYDNKTLLDSQVQALVTAMSNFAPPALGETTMSQSLRNSLETPLGAWQ